MHAYFNYSFFLLLKHKCYIVATCDRDLKRRIRKIPGVPIMYITRHRYVSLLCHLYLTPTGDNNTPFNRYSIERMPDDYGGKLITEHHWY